MTPSELRALCETMPRYKVARKYRIGRDRLDAMLGYESGEEPTDWTARIDELEASGMTYADAVNKVLALWTKTEITSGPTPIEPTYFARMDGRSIR